MDAFVGCVAAMDHVPHVDLVQIVQTFFRDGANFFTKTPQRHEPTSSSPLGDHTTASPVSLQDKMSLLDEAKRVAAEFNYDDAAVRNGVEAFIKQMSMWSWPSG